MNEPYLGQTTDMVLGQEFLTWLWFRSETQPMGFKDKEGVPFSMNLEQRIVVQGGEGDSLETASVSGSLSQLGPPWPADGQKGDEGPCPFRTGRIGLANDYKGGRFFSWQFQDAKGGKRRGR